MKYSLPLNGEWVTYSDTQLKAMRQDKAQAELAKRFLALYHEFEKNRFAFFLAHGEAMKFINDDTSKLCIIIAPNQVGKTIALIVWLLRRMLKLNPGWPCFKNHGMEMREWQGHDARFGIASYQMTVHCQRNLWPKLRLMMPEDQHKKKGKHLMTPNWQGAPVTSFADGPMLDYFAYQQLPEAFESMTYNGFAFDEQVTEPIFDAVYARGITQEGFQSAIAATPHKIKGRPDTGKAGWVMRMIDGYLDKGIDFKVYRITVDDVPDCIMSPEKKAEAFRMYITAPLASGDARRIRNGRARYYGEAESSEGLVYDNFDRNIHVIDDFKLSPHWTKFRAIDPGRVDPYAVLWGVMTPWADFILYREYYKRNLGLSENILNVIAASGNSRELVDQQPDGDGNIIKSYEERFIGEEYAWTVMDGHAFVQPTKERGITFGRLHASKGIYARQASMMQNRNALKITKPWFDLIPGRPHILERMGIVPKGSLLGVDGRPLTGAPRTYVFHSLRNFRSEIAGYVNKPDKDEPMDKDDHLMTAFKYMMLKGPSYSGEEDPSFNLEYGPEYLKHRKKTAVPQSRRPTKYTGHTMGPQSID